MGVDFTYKDHTIWDPSLMTGNVFVGQVNLLAARLKIPSGVVPTVGDEFLFHPLEFPAFLAALLDYKRHTHNECLQLMLSGVLTVMLAVHHAMGGHWHPQAPADLQSKAATLAPHFRPLADSALAT